MVFFVAGEWFLTGIVILILWLPVGLLLAALIGWLLRRFPSRPPRDEDWQ